MFQRFFSILFFLIFSALPATAEPDFTPEEKAWIRTAPELVVGAETDYAPFNFTDEKGRATGYSNELFEIVAKKAGLRYRFESGPTWDEMLRRVRSGRIDVLTCAWINDERLGYMLFVTPAYAKHMLGIAVRSDDRNPPTRTNMRGKLIVLVKGFAINGQLRTDHPDAIYLETETPVEALKLISFGKADGYIDGVGVINYLSVQQGFANVRISDEFELKGSDYHIAVSRKNPMLHGILTKALAAVTEDETLALQNRWLRPALPLAMILRPYRGPAVALLVLAAGVFAVLTLWNRRLSHEVMLRTVAEDAARLARLQAEDANRLKSEFLANMSHEIRTPMNAILGYTRLMQRDPALPAAQLARVSTINRAGEHLLTLINDILEMSKIEAGRITLNNTAFDLYAMLDGLIELYGVRARAKGILLELDRPEGLPRYIVSDEAKLRQSVLNLISNAVKFTKDGGVTVTVTTENSGGGAFTLRVAVRDSGPGLTPEEIGKLFRAFVQSSAGVKAGGTGLGLAISRRYARLLGGDISVKSEPGKGATFTLTVRASGADAAGATRRAAPPAVLRLADDSAPVRILVADDVAMNRELLDAILRPMGFEVRLAENGARAAEVFKEWKPHAILMDMRMPVMDGYEACRTIKREPGGPETFILALTASAFEEEKAAILASGADAFMRKPFRQDEMLELLGERLKLRYVYADTPAHAADTDSGAPPEPEALAAISGELRSAMLRAANEADYERLLELCERLAETDFALAEKLRKLIAGFDYESLSRVLSPKP